MKHTKFDIYDAHLQSLAHRFLTFILNWKIHFARLIYLLNILLNCRHARYNFRFSKITQQNNPKLACNSSIFFEKRTASKKSLQTTFLSLSITIPFYILNLKNNLPLSLNILLHCQSTIKSKPSFTVDFHILGRIITQNINHKRKDIHILRILDSLLYASIILKYIN